MCTPSDVETLSDSHNTELDIVSLGPSISYCNASKIWEAEHKAVGARSPWWRVVNRCGEMSGARKEVYETPKRLSALYREERLFNVKSY